MTTRKWVSGFCGNWKHFPLLEQVQRRVALLGLRSLGLRPEQQRLHGFFWGLYGLVSVFPPNKLPFQTNVCNYFPQFTLNSMRGIGCYQETQPKEATPVQSVMFNSQPERADVENGVRIKSP